MSVVAAVQGELDALPGVLAESAAAAAALALAEELDDPGNSATSKSMVAKELRETMAALRALAPPKVEEDEVERARRRRSERLGRSEAGASSSS